MKVHLSTMVQDPMTAPFEGAGGRIVEGFYYLTEQSNDVFLDGPVTKRVAVLDFDAATGQLLPGARFRPPDKRYKVGRYVVADKDDIYARDFIQVSVLGAVLKAIRMIEAGEVLGRPIQWAFDGPQLLVVPQAGQWANAFYDRNTRSLQFFSFPNPNNPAQTVHTSLSRDIVAHETGHAILDGIAPSLYDATTPQSLAIHEAVADLTALLTAFRSHELSRRVLDHTRGSIRNSTAFSSLAPEFGAALDQSGHAGALRSLWNDKTLDPRDTSRDERGRPNRVDATDPHSLSEVLTGALYSVMVRMHDYERERLGGSNKQREFSASGRALARTSKRFEQLIFSALDYMPPGEVSFADFARAWIAASGFGGGFWDKAEVEWSKEEFVRRGIVGSLDELQRYSSRGWEGRIDHDSLLESESAAYDFVNRNRKPLKIPYDVPFHVYPRLAVNKSFMSEYDSWESEFILKVTWDVQEEGRIDRNWPSRRRLMAGTTLVVDRESGWGKSVLTTDIEPQREQRTEMIRKLADTGALAYPGEALGSDQRRMAAPVGVYVRDGVLALRGAARMLHMVAT